MRWNRIVASIGFGALVAAMGSAGPARALDIVINADSNLMGNAAALAAFERAALEWEAIFTDDITVTIDGGFEDLGNPNIIGQAGSVLLSTGYDTIRAVMVADAAGEADDGIVASLPTAAGFSATLPVGFGLDGDLAGTKALLKAMGFTGLDGAFGATDATITFNSTFSFDYDNGDMDGVGDGLTDFETVAMHEIGHVLGFTSVVDDIDVLQNLGMTGNVSPSPLDLFRFDFSGGGNPASVGDFATFSRNLTPGVEAVFDDVSGLEERLSSGFYTGDGSQASHWKADEITTNNIGVMDPTLGVETVTLISDADIRLLDLIGWDVVPVPEPSTALLLILGLGGLTRVGRRQQPAGLERRQPV